MQARQALLRQAGAQLIEQLPGGERRAQQALSRHRGKGNCAQ
jgi:hypothetical protein